MKGIREGKNIEINANKILIKPVYTSLTNLDVGIDMVGAEEL